MLIGITGQIGAGKSTAAGILKSLGAALVDADRIGRQVVNRNPMLLKKLSAAFGKDILTRTGKLNRRKLAELAFVDEKKRRMLNQLVHPYLLKELENQIRVKSKKAKVIVIDAALLLEWNLDRLVDLTVVIHTSRERRLRFLANRGIGRRDALARERRQMKFAEYRARADIVIYNSSTEAAFEDKVKRMWQDRVLPSVISGNKLARSKT